MSTDDALDQAIKEWRTKHHLEEGDPIVAGVELVRIYLELALKGTAIDPVHRPAQDAFLDALYEFTEGAPAFSRENRDLVIELRRALCLFHNAAKPNSALLLVIACLALVAGYYLGRL